MSAPGPPWLYLEAAAGILVAGAWIAMSATWFGALPLTRAVRITGITVCLSAAAGTLLSFAGKAAAPVAAVNHLIGAAAFLAFVVALAGLFRRAAARNRPQVEEAPPATDPEWS